MSAKPFAITLKVGSSLANKTGNWRTARPIYVNRQPPCNAKCPAGEKCQAWLFHAESGDYRKAWEQVIESNPFPAVMGRICYHTCESACNRAELDESVGINAVERFLGDHALAEGWQFERAQPSSGKRVLIVGAGPAGLSCAYHLARLGHGVEIRESAAAPGGMMRYGIPSYRLPRGILDAEIERIKALGVKIVLNHQVSSLKEETASGGFDAVFLAAGAPLARRAYIPAGDASHIKDAVEVLHEVEAARGELQFGRQVVVYGGGNTAIDVARTVKRMGSEPIVVYRRTREKAPAHDFEIKEAIEEGISMKWLSTISDVDGKEVRVEKMVLDENGRPQPTGEYELLEADTVVLALGQETNLEFLDGIENLEIESGLVKVDGFMRTAVSGIFAGGDMANNERNATVAIGQGKRAARSIDAFLRGSEPKAEPHQESADFARLNTWYYADAPKSVRPQLDIVRRQTTFEEVLRGLTEENALYEARRCMSCGNCFECDNCYGVCPDNAVVKLGPGKKFAINYEFCKGCGICANECPCGAIDMVSEDI